MTGPSFTISTCISVRNRPVATVAPSSRQTCHHPLDERLGNLGTGGIDPARSPTLVGVAVQGELTDHQHLGRPDELAAIGERTVHHPGLVVEDAKVPDLVGQLVGRRDVVAVGDTDQDTQPGTDRADTVGRAVDERVDARSDNPLHQPTHTTRVARRPACETMTP